MLAVLLLCTVIALGIREFKGVFGYLVQLWSLLAPPVFVRVVAGIFSRRATARGAVATLTVGSVLGAVTFWALGRPEVVAQLPLYLRSALNCGLVIALVCAAVMALFSRRGGANPGAAEVAERTSAATAKSMSPGERRTYHLTRGALAFVWLAVVVTFSPWGVGHARWAVPASQEFWILGLDVAGVAAPGWAGRLNVIPGLSDPMSPNR